MFEIDLSRCKAEVLRKYDIEEVENISFGSECQVKIVVGLWFCVTLQSPRTCTQARGTAP